MKRYFLLVFAITLGFLFVQAQERSTSGKLNVDEIVNTYLENIGGADKWKALSSIRMEVEISQMGMEFTGLMMLAPPNKQRMDITIQGLQMTEAYDGKDAWWINPLTTTTEAQLMPAEMAAKFTEEEFENIFIDYKKKGHKLEYTGDVEVEGVVCHELKMTRKNGTEELHYFNPEYMFPIMQRTVATNDQAQGQVVEIYFSDYVEFGGLTMPKTIETRVDGTSQLTMKAVKVELDVEFENSLFAYPGDSQMNKD